MSKPGSTAHCPLILDFSSRRRCAGGECLVATRDGDRVLLTGADDPALCASAVFAWIASNRELPASLTVNGTPVSVG